MISHYCYRYSKSEKIWYLINYFVPKTSSYCYDYANEISGVIYIPIEQWLYDNRLFMLYRIAYTKDEFEFLRRTIEDLEEQDNIYNYENNTNTSNMAYYHGVDLFCLMECIKDNDEDNNESENYKTEIPVAAVWKPYKGDFIHVQGSVDIDIKLDNGCTFDEIKDTIVFVLSLEHKQDIIYINTHECT